MYIHYIQYIYCKFSMWLAMSCALHKWWHAYFWSLVCSKTSGGSLWIIANGNRMGHHCSCFRPFGEKGNCLCCEDMWIVFFSTNGLGFKMAVSVSIYFNISIAPKVYDLQRDGCCRHVARGEDLNEASPVSFCWAMCFEKHRKTDV